MPRTQTIIAVIASLIALVVPQPARRHRRAARRRPTGWWTPAVGALMLAFAVAGFYFGVAS